jgi:hypothetical protein
VSLWWSCGLHNLKCGLTALELWDILEVDVQVLLGYEHCEAVFDVDGEVCRILRTELMKSSCFSS